MNTSQILNLLLNSIFIDPDNRWQDNSHRIVDTYVEDDKDQSRLYLTTATGDTFRLTITHSERFWDR